MKQENTAWFRKGIHHGTPIALGYLAVSFTLGIAAKNAGMTAWQGACASVTTVASAGEFAGFQVIAAGASYLEMAVMMLVINARYMLMSCSLSQKLDPDLPFFHRLILGWGITDEIFGVASSVPDKLNPWYNYGMMAISIPGWTLGTFVGIAVGNVLPAHAVSALSVGLYGMFLAIIIPPARKNRVIAGLVAISMLASFAMAKLPLVSGISSGMRTIILTVVIAGVAAVLFPVKEEQNAA
ncbi:MAG: AzlC family ABC transporter permease [Eubacteriales bacterium]|nr:AzlC family ABC transporter permease [Eubacteriales bacterium]